MGHYLSDFEDRPRYYFEEFRALGYKSESVDVFKSVMVHQPCLQVFWASGGKPVPETLIKHAEVCNG